MKAVKEMVQLGSEVTGGLGGARSFQVEEGHPSAAWRTGAWGEGERETVWTGFRASLWGQRPRVARAVLVVREGRGQRWLSAGGTEEGGPEPRWQEAQRGPPSGSVAVKGRAYARLAFSVGDEDRDEFPMASLRWAGRKGVRWER